MVPEFKKKMWLEFGKAMAGAVLLGLLVLVVFVGGKSLANDIAEKRAALNELVKAINMREVLEAESEVIRQNYAALEGQFPEAALLGDYLAKLAESAKNYKLEFSLLAPKDFDGASGSFLPLSFSLAGSYKNTQNFLSALASEFPAIRLDKVELNRRTAGGYDVGVAGVVFLRN